MYVRVQYILYIPRLDYLTIKQLLLSFYLLESLPKFIVLIFNKNLFSHY